MRRKIAICDDEKVMLRQISQYLSQIQEETGDSYDLYYYASGEELTAHLPEGIQVILLDISMGGMTGMECARILWARGFERMFIFITSMVEYALEGYEVHAFAFLTKPLLYADLKNRLVECFASVDRTREVILPVETAQGMEYLPIREIFYAEVFQHETSFALPSGRVASTIQLSQAEERLTAHGFFRCHRSYLVNMAQIKRIGQDVLTMPDGVSIPLSKHRRHAFLDAFSSYMGGSFV